MPWAAGATLVAGYLGSKASKSAANSQSSADRQALDQQEKQYQQTYGNLSPYIGAGQSALGAQQAYLGGDTSGFDQSSDYKFAVSQGTKALDAGAASKGNLWGGGADADRIALGQGLATQYANNYWNKITGVANSGQQAAQALGNFGQANSNAAGNYLTNAGQANASGTIGQANAWGNVLGQLGNLYGLYGQFGGTSVPAGGSSSSYSLGNNIGNYWTNPNIGTASNNGSYNFASMSGGY